MLEPTDRHALQIAFNKIATLIEQKNDFQRSSLIDHYYFLVVQQRSKEKRNHSPQAPAYSVFNKNQDGTESDWDRVSQSTLEYLILTATRHFAQEEEKLLSTLQVEEGDKRKKEARKIEIHKKFNEFKIFFTHQTNIWRYEIMLDIYQAEQMVFGQDYHDEMVLQAAIANEIKTRNRAVIKQFAALFPSIRGKILCPCSRESLQ